MSFETNTISMKEACEQIIDCPHSTPQWTTTGVVVLRSKNIRNGRLDLAAEPSFTTEDGYRDRIRRAVPRSGDLVITREAPMGEVCMLPPGLRCCLGQRMVLLRSNRQKIDPLYLLFAIQSPYMQHQILMHEGTGSTVSNLRIPALEGLRVPWKPLPEQRRIAAILGALDDKIELNRKMNRTLEEMAQALFKSWFIDFDGHEDLVESELGPIPRGWSSAFLNDQIEFAIGGQWGVNPADEKHTEEVYCIHGTDIPAMNFGERGEAPQRFLMPSSLKKRRLQRGDLVFEVSGGSPTQSTGRVLLITDTRVARFSAPIVCSNFCRTIRPKKWADGLYLYFLLDHMYRRGDFFALENGTTGIKNLPFANFSETFALLMPPQLEIARFASVVGPLIEKIDANGLESHILAELRDTLLPKLISGELRTPEAESTKPVTYNIKEA